MLIILIKVLNYPKLIEAFATILFYSKNVVLYSINQNIALIFFWKSG